MLTSDSKWWGWKHLFPVTLSNFQKKVGRKGEGWSIAIPMVDGKKLLLYPQADKSNSASKAAWRHEIYTLSDSIYLL